MTRDHIIGIDWGSSSFRAWLVDDEGRIVDALTEPRGVLFSGPGEQRAWLAQTLANWQAKHSVSQILGVGMIGSRTGISESPYLPVPATREQWTAERRSAGLINGAPLWIYPGLSSRADAGDDVMRGEEFITYAVVDKSSGIVVCPGTHSKWLLHEAGSILSFATYVTGELFALWSKDSSISEYLTGGQSREGIEIGLRLAGTFHDVLAGLFPLRAGLLSGRISAQDLSGALSGLLVGREVADALARFGNPSDVTLVAEGQLLDVYTAALEAKGVRITVKKMNPGAEFHALAGRGSAEKVES